MSDNPPEQVARRPWWVVVLAVLLLAQTLSIVLVFQRFAWTRTNVPFIRLYAAGLGLLAVVTLFGLWTQRGWAAWAVLSLATLKLVVDIMAWALRVTPELALVSAVVNVVAIALAFRYELGAGAGITRGMRIFFASVLVLAAWVGFWGLFAPLRVDKALPFLVPPLHARILGAMYWSGAAFMLACILAKRWAEIRIVTPMISFWTGMLGIVSLLYLGLFDWALSQTWIWFGAYLAFPAMAAWITWRQRFQDDQAGERGMPAPLRVYLYAQGSLLTLLAALLLLAPSFMTSVWPWPIMPVLAQIYSAPFLAYGLGSLLAARQHTWAEARFAVYGTLVFGVLVLVASFLHSSLFDFDRLTTWVWFGGFILATGSLAAFTLALPWRPSELAR
jgi:hypothetical protein